MNIVWKNILGNRGKATLQLSSLSVLIKRPPLIASVFAKQEDMDFVLNFYRTNKPGGNENFYTIELKKALIISCHFSQPHTIIKCWTLIEANNIN